jgi:hypothetical protein
MSVCPAISSRISRVSAVSSPGPPGRRVCRAVPSPKLRPVRQVIPGLTCGFSGLAGWCCGYFKLSGIETPMSSKAWRCALVGSASIGMATGVPVKLTWLRVKVARWSSRPRKV